MDSHADGIALKSSTLGKQLVMLRSFLRFCDRSGRTEKDLSEVVPHAASWRLSKIPEPMPEVTIEALLDSLDLRSRRVCGNARASTITAGAGHPAGLVAVNLMLTTKPSTAARSAAAGGVA